MSPEGRVVVFGDLMVDVVATASAPLARGSDAPATVRTHGGGSAANVASRLAAARVPVALVCRVGDDAAGRAAVAELEAQGVEVHAQHDADLPTGTCVVVVEPDGERTFLPDRGANAALAPGSPAIVGLRPDDHLHVSGYALLDAGPARDAALEALAVAREVGASSSVDPASSAPLRREGAERFLGWVAGTTTLLPNAAEAAALTGLVDPAAAARALARASGAEVVVTLGAAGALWTDGTRVARDDGKLVPGGDSTGAGDAFAAGWLAARRAGAGIPEALRAANAAGALAVAAPGARPAPT